MFMSLSKFNWLEKAAGHLLGPNDFDRTSRQLGAWVAPPPSLQLAGR